ncbi:MAG: substrate-binding domain-containing protein [Chloroflexi bacterium]|nr:substrate-binding domain-containing protein [Chloroflexota bacterium]
MQQNKTLFFGIIGLAILIVIALIAARFFLGDQLELPTLTEKVSIRIVVAPSIKSWAEQAAQTFNQNNPNTQVEIVAADQLIPQAQFGSTGQPPPPAAWLAEATFVIEMARQRDLQFQDAQPVASTSLAWGAFKTKQEEFNQKYGGLNWQGLHARAVSSEDRLRFVIASPFNSAEGLAALIAATAAYRQKQTVSSDDVSQADQWLTETFRDNTQTPATPAADFATKGVSTGDAGILSMASWRNARLLENPNFSVSPAQPNMNLDYPLAIFSQAEPAAQQAAVAFRNFLLEESQQNALASFFIDPASAAQAGVKADGAAAQRLLDWANRELP